MWKGTQLRLSIDLYPCVTGENRVTVHGTSESQQTGSLIERAAWLTDIIALGLRISCNRIASQFAGSFASHA